MNRISLLHFIAARKTVSNICEAIGCSNWNAPGDAPAGFIYPGNHYIELGTGKDAGCYGLTLANGEMVASRSLSELEAQLYIDLAGIGELPKEDDQPDAFARALTENDLDKALLHIMDPLGITDGGIAGIVFSGDRDREWWTTASVLDRRLALKDWLASELAHTAVEGN